MAREKTTGVFFKMSPEELKLFEKRMEQTGIKNKSAFIRKMCIDGHVFVYESETINEIGRLLRITSNNVNQIARRVNSGDNPYRSEIRTVTEQQTEIIKCFGKMLTLLSEVASDKPGKRFIAPPKVNDMIEERI